VSFISEECVVSTQEAAEQVMDILRKEIECRVENKGQPLKPSKQPQEKEHEGFNADLIRQYNRMPRDTYVRKNESSARMKMNQTQTLNTERKVRRDDLNQT
jgi:hypothetical protein